VVVGILVAPLGASFFVVIRRRLGSTFARNAVPFAPVVAGCALCRPGGSVVPSSEVAQRPVSVDIVI
jgi:hypothetical protein